MGSYLDSPMYQRMMAETLRGSQRGPQYPAEAGLNALATALGAYQVRQFGQREQAKEDATKQDYARALGNAMGPKDNSAWDAGPELDAQGQPGQLSISPRVGASSQARLGAAFQGSPELAAQMGPEIAKQLLNQKTTLSPEDAIAAGFRPGSVVQQGPNGDYSTAQASDVPSQGAREWALQQKAAPGPAPQAAVAPTSEAQDWLLREKAAPGAPGQPDSPELFAQKQKLAQIRADIAAQTQGEFGRSMQGKAYNILAAGLTNPAARSTPEYATAWQILSNPRVDPNTGTIVTPDLSAFAPPTSGTGPQAAPGQSTASGAQSGAPAQRMPSVQSFAPPNPSQPEAASAGYANRLAESSGIIDKTQGAATSAGQNVKGSIPLVGNYLTGAEYQQFDQAQRNFINAQLRRESGAAISQSEFDNAYKQYLPRPGDSPEVLKQKKAARDMATRNMQLSAGNVLMPPGVLQQSSPGKNAPVIPMEQGFGSAPAQNVIRYDAQGRRIP